MYVVFCSLARILKRYWATCSPSPVRYLRYLSQSVLNLQYDQPEYMQSFRGLIHSPCSILHTHLLQQPELWTCGMLVIFCVAVSSLTHTSLVFNNWLSTGWGVPGGRVWCQHARSPYGTEHRDSFWRRWRDVGHGQHRVQQQQQLLLLQEGEQLLTKIFIQMVLFFLLPLFTFGPCLWIPLDSQFMYGTTNLQEPAKSAWLV